MDKLVIKGQKRLQGSANISGAKNAVVAIIPAAILAQGTSIIENLPNIEDVHSFAYTLADLGINCSFSQGKMTIDIPSYHSHIAITDNVQKFRASYYLMGVFLAKFKKAKVKLPGGCNFGTRPIDQHLRGFKALGAEVNTEGDIISLEAKELKGAHIYLDMASVGATINIMFAAVFAEGVTTIENAAKEPHVVDTANFLNKMGANIKGAGTDIIKITGVLSLKGTEYTIIPDQIEAGTYMIAAAITHGDVTVRNIIPKHMEFISAKLAEMGCEIEEGDDFIRVKASGKLNGTSVKTMAYPGFPTDLNPQMTTLLATCKGTSYLTENIWEDRFQYIKELQKFGTDISINGRTATINEVSHFKAAQVKATDLRAGAAMILAGLAAKGETYITNVKFIDRGYEFIEQKLTNLGADIKRISGS